MAQDNATASTRVLIERALALGLLALLLLGVLRVLQPFAMAITFGAFITIATWPLRQAVVRAGVSPGKAALGMFLVVLGLVVVPAVVLAPALPEQIRHVLNMVSAALAHAPPEPPRLIAGIPVLSGWARDHWSQITAAQGDLKALLAPYSGQITALLVDLGSAAAESLLQVFLSLIVTAMFWINGDELAAVLRELCGRIGGPAGAEAVDAAGGAVRGVAWGIVGTAALQGLLMGIGLTIAGVPGAAMLGFLTFVFSVTQVLAPLIIAIWAGAAYWLFGLEQVGWAVVVIGVGVLVSFADNIVRPLLISRGSPMPLTLIILGVFGGLIAFGFLGLFIGPALLAVAHGLVRAWRGQPA